MRLFAVLLLFSLFSLSLKAQYAGQFQLGVATEANYHWQTNQYSITGGVKANIWISDFISLNYNLQLGADSEYGFTANSGLGQLLAIAIAVDTTIIEGKTARASLAILSAIVPEGFSIAVNPYSDWVIIPYINPIEFHVLAKDSHRAFRIGGEVGVKLSFLVNDPQTLQTKIGLRYLYGKNRWGITWGLSYMFL